jgi:co-chaperonin GroES (HSP10)
MRAVGKYIIIEKDNKTTKKTNGGLILDESNREDIRYRKAIVINVGSEVIAIKEKDEIYYDRHAGFGVEIGEDEFKVIKEQDVVIIL